MSVELALPQTAGTREIVDVLLDEQGIPSDLSGESLVINGGNVKDASPSFADELVRRLASRGPKSVILEELPDGLANQIRLSAKLRRFSAMQ